MSLSESIHDTNKCEFASGKTGNLIVITGPSGVGKGTVVEELTGQVPYLSRSVSVTTRCLREGEIEGVSYFFKSEEEFQGLCRDDRFLEWAEFAGCHYGTPRDWVESQLGSGIDVILEIEVVGAMQIRQRCPEAVLIFLSPPTFAELETRLRGRGTESEDKIALRLNKAREELSQKHLFHYEVINDKVDEAVNNLVHIIYAERLRVRNSASRAI